jgi:UDP-N-acetylglucosamine 2-epimerase (non-hydrolysing)
MIKLLSVVGARPNFIKIAPLHKAFRGYPEVKHLICHTGQHFDEKMSKVFFEELEMPEPDFYLGISGGSHAVQTAGIMVEFEKILLAEKPDLVIVPGDVNSTMACSIVASKAGIPVAHIESGLRSFDRRMPEEVNRVITDHIADYLFVSEKSGIINLDNEGIASDKIFFVGNIMIDSLIQYLPVIEKSEILRSLDLNSGQYILATFHRPSNVDDKDNLKGIFTFLGEIAKMKKVVFPVHPRTRNNLKGISFSPEQNKDLIMTDPLGYTDFLKLVKNAALVITDSGGIQEETTFLGVQCITVRENTERPVTVDAGTNQLIGTDLEKVKAHTLRVLGGELKKGSIPELWDGRTAERVAGIIVKFFSEQ